MTDVVFGAVEVRERNAGAWAVVAPQGERVFGALSGGRARAERLAVVWNGPGVSTRVVAADGSTSASAFTCVRDDDGQLRVVE